MAAIGFIQQFALLNQITLQGHDRQQLPDQCSVCVQGTCPAELLSRVRTSPAAQGLDFNDASGNNVALVTGIINANVPGFYVFSAPWETISALLANIKKHQGL